MLQITIWAQPRRTSGTLTNARILSARLDDLGDAMAAQGQCSAAVFRAKRADRYVRTPSLGPGGGAPGATSFSSLTLSDRQREDQATAASKRNARRQLEREADAGRRATVAIDRRRV